MNAITFENVSKYYASTEVQASDNVSFSIRKGEIHAICGENGAGKSTLMNILFGLERMDSGRIFINEKEVEIRNASDALGYGIGMVHQHFKLVSSFTVAQSILLGTEDKMFISKKQEEDAVGRLAEAYSLPIDPCALIDTLPVGMLQRVEILKMLIRNVDILILDEPTAVLTPNEVGPFLDTLRNLKDKGKTIIFISHKLQEVLDASDRITVMRKGRVIGTKDAKDTTMEELADMMVGRKVLFSVEKKEADRGEVVLDVEHLDLTAPSGLKVLKDVSFSIRRGEIYGIAGVSGNGQEALVRAIAGNMDVSSGKIRILNKEVQNLSIQKKRDAGLAYVPEDRIHVGLNMDATLEDNSILGYENDKEFRKGPFLDEDKIRKRSLQMIKDYQIHGASVDGLVSKLSGGNMQKVVLAREFAHNPDLLIVDQPVRGLDVGSIEFVHKAIIKERDRGAAVLLVSVELDEILSLSDRVGVMYSGSLVGELEGKDINEKNIALLMVGKRGGEIR